VAKFRDRTCSSFDTAPARAKQRRAFTLARGVQRSTAMIERVASNLESYMTLLSVRQKLVASNVANADTPGYRTKDIDFQTEFRNAAQGSTAAPTIVEAQGLYLKNDGNNVSVDRESRLLAENALRFKMAVNLARSELRQIRLAITEGSAA
jgi:flagellar basal-body rod protein FlgB